MVSLWLRVVSVMRSRVERMQMMVMSEWGVIVESARLPAAGCLHLNECRGGGARLRPCKHGECDVVMRGTLDQKILESGN